MTVGRLIDWLGRLTAGHLPPETRTERVLRADSVIEVAKILRQQEFELVRLHDIEGYSIQALHDVTGLPDDTIRENVTKIRERLCHLITHPEPEEPPRETEIVL